MGDIIAQSIHCMMNPLRFLSPFRYPGGKTWFAPYIRQWLNSLTSKPTNFIEPFAGGGSIGLLVAAERLADRVTLVEYDEQVAAVWRTIIYGDWKWLAERIITFHFTPQTVQAELTREPRDLAELAFQTILRNRIRHGGILAPGAGILQRGESERGLYSRWYPETLRDRIKAIAGLRGRITFIQGDGITVVQRFASHPDVAFFIDPPYTADDKKAGRRLYRYHYVDHGMLFTLASTLAGDFLMTYSDHMAVLTLAQEHSLDFRRIPMRNTHHSSMQEIIIGRDLKWMPSQLLLYE